MTQIHKYLYGVHAIVDYFEYFLVMVLRLLKVVSMQLHGIPRIQHISQALVMMAKSNCKSA